MPDTYLTNATFGGSYSYMPIYIYNEKKRKGRGTAGRSIIIARHFECHVVSRYIYMRLCFLKLTCGSENDSPVDL